MSALTAPRWYTGDDWAGAVDLVRTSAAFDRVRKYAGAGDDEWVVWLAALDQRVARRTGLSVFDLSDYCWRDLFDDGLTPRDAWAVFLEDGGLLS